MHQNLKSSLSKVVVGCQGRLDVVLAHYGEGNAIGQGPGFIRSFAESGTALLKEIMAGRHDFHIRLALERPGQRNEFLPGTRHR